MAAQEAVQGLLNPAYVKNEPAVNNGYDYGYQNQGAYYNPYMHYGEPPPQHLYQPPTQHLHYPTHQSGSNGQEMNSHYQQINHMNHHYGHPMEASHHSLHQPATNYSMMPGPNHAGMYKEESIEDPYSFVDEDPMLVSQRESAVKVDGQSSAAPKKRGRKKKIQPPESDFDLDGNGMEMTPLTMDLMPMMADGLLGPDGQPNKRKYTKSDHYKQRRRHDRFNGMSEDEVRLRTLPDHLTSNLDVVIIGINPGLFAAYKGHHYAGPGNHFWKCLFLAGLVPEPMTADDDFKLLHFGIGFTNMVARPTKGSADLTRKEIRDGGRILLEKLQRFRPKIAVFNGKGIYEVFSGKKEFSFGKQPECIDGTNTFIWVMPSSSARCAQLPRAMDKVPFYSGLKKFRDFLNGLIPEIDDSEMVFNDPKIRAADDGSEISEHLKVDSVSSDDMPIGIGASEFGEERNLHLTGLPAPPPLMDHLMQPGMGELPVKKKRGRPKKIRPDGTVAVKPERPPPLVQASTSGEFGLDGGPPKKKRGRPKKIRTTADSMLPVSSSSSSSIATQLDMNGSVGSNGSHHSLPETGPPSASPAPSVYMNNHHPGQQQQQQHGPPMDYYGRSPTNGPLSGLCNDSTSSLGRQSNPSPCQSVTNTSPRQPDGPPSLIPLGGPPTSLKTVETVGPPLAAVSTASVPPPLQQQQQPPLPQESHIERVVVESSPFTPPMSFRPTPSASGIGYHTHNQDVASKSLSGLESLVDQIPNLTDGEPQQQQLQLQQQQQQQQQQQHALHVHHQAVSNSFSHYTASQPSYSYQSSSFGHYAPHYSTPGTSSGATNPYSQGALEHGFNGQSAYSSPQSFGPTASQMNGSLHHPNPSFSPYSSYGQAYAQHHHAAVPNAYYPYPATSSSNSSAPSANSYPYSQSGYFDRT